MSELATAIVVISTYSEADNIPAVIDRVRSAAPSITILVVDDRSATAPCPHRLAQLNAPITGVLATRPPRRDRAAKRPDQQRLAGIAPGIRRQRSPAAGSGSACAGERDPSATSSPRAFKVNRPDIVRIRSDPSLPASGARSRKCLIRARSPSVSTPMTMALTFSR